MGIIHAQIICSIHQPFKCCIHPFTQALIELYYLLHIFLLHYINTLGQIGVHFLAQGHD